MLRIKMHPLQILSKISYICPCQMRITISKYQVKQLHAEGGHVYLKATVKIEDKLKSIEVFLRSIGGKEIFSECHYCLEW